MWGSISRMLKWETLNDEPGNHPDIIVLSSR